VVVKSIFLSLLLAFALTSGHAMSISGKLKLTGGVSTTEGAAGGGLNPWALIGGYGTRDQVGVQAFHTDAKLSDYNLESNGIAVGIFNRVELSFAQQSFDTKYVGAALGIGQGYRLKQNIFGAKVRLLGDAVLDQASYLPQISLGVQYKKNADEAIVKSLGATKDSGIDYYLSATKILLNYSILLNATVRMTKANQLGLLGFGGNKNDSYKPQAEVSVGYLVCNEILAGAEYRTKPDNLNVAVEDNWSDIYVAWTPTKNISLTAAYLMLGNIALRDDQTGFYGSLQLGF
jgi:hypothetical protein